MLKKTKKLKFWECLSRKYKTEVRERKKKPVGMPLSH